MPEYRGKKLWLPSTGSDCIHCGGPIQHRPSTLGISLTPDGEGITTHGLFNSWPCERAYAIDNKLLNDEVERRTTTIMLDFRDACDQEDDREGHIFLQKYNRFSDVPRAPPRSSFRRYGGTLSDDEYRATWTHSSEVSEGPTFGDSIDNRNNMDPFAREEVSSIYESNRWEGDAQAFNSLIPTPGASNRGFGFSTRGRRKRLATSGPYWLESSVPLGWDTDFDYGD